MFQLVTRLNPVFQPILTVTIVTVNQGQNTGFSPVTDLNKGCSLLRLLKLNVCQGACSSVKLDTDIFIGTSVLNCQTLKTLFKASALWADAFYKQKCPSVRVSVCPSVRLFTFEVPFNGLFAPPSRSRMSNIFRDSESLGKSNGKKRSQI